MSQIILTHTGSPVPDYVEFCVKQLEFSNPTVGIALINDEKHGGADYASRLQLGYRSVEDLEDDPLVQRFREVSWFKAWGKPNTVYPSPENFVQGTSERLFLLAAHLKRYKIDDVWHFENDNMIYGNVNVVTPHLATDRITCCYMNEKHTVWNVVYIPKHDMLYEAMEWYVEQLAKGNEWICKTYGLEMAHEMTVMRHYEKLAFFPSLPHQKSIEGFYFDPASYGQYIGGTNNGHPPGFRDTVNHDIGKTYNILWKDAVFNRTSLNPWIIDMGGNFNALFNLHVHNKFKMGELKSWN